MADLLPNRCHEQRPGLGFRFERELCDLMRTQLPGSYTMLHSAVLEARERAQGQARPYPAEVDFVIVGPNGVFLIEAKRIECVVGDIYKRWIYKEKGGGRDVFPESGGEYPGRKMSDNLKAAKKRIERSFQGRFAPFDEAKGVFVFPAGAELAIRDQGGTPRERFEGGLLRLTRAPDLVKTIVDAPPPLTKDGARPSLLTSAQAAEVARCFDPGIPPNPDVTENYQILGRDELRRAANGLPYMVCALRHELGKLRRGKWYDMSALGEKDRALFDAQVRRHAQVVQDASPHPNILTYHTFFTNHVRSSFWVIEDYVDADTLAQKLDAGDPLPARDISRGIAGGLKAIHGTRHVWRDLRPDSVLIDRSNGRVMLTNFEAAKSLEGAHTVWDAGADLKDDPYRAPEVQLGGGHEADVRADVYSWAAVTFHVLAGRPPESPDDAALLDRAALPAPMAALIKQALSPYPEDRPPNIDAVLAAFKAWPA